MLRKKKNFSQADLAKETGISRDAISKYERGDIIPTVVYAKKLADALGISMDYLISEEEKQEVLDVKMMNRMKAIQKLTDNEQQHIISVIDAFVSYNQAKQAFATK